MFTLLTSKYDNDWILSKKKSALQYLDLLEKNIQVSVFQEKIYVLLYIAFRVKSSNKINIISLEISTLSNHFEN